MGSYAVVATVNNAKYAGSANGTLNIAPVLPLAITAAATAITGTTATCTARRTRRDRRPGFLPILSDWNAGRLHERQPDDDRKARAAGTANVPFRRPISGLTPPIIYHYRAVATKPAGTAFRRGQDVHHAGRSRSSEQHPSGAYLERRGPKSACSVNPNGVATSVYFEYSTDINFSTFLMTTAQSIGSGKVRGQGLRAVPGTDAEYDLLLPDGDDERGGDRLRPDRLSPRWALIRRGWRKQGDFAVGASGPTFASFGNPAVNVNDDVAFAGTLTLATGVITAANDIGIWTDHSRDAATDRANRQAQRRARRRTSSP